ncbi:polysaccharide biosynthesis protein [Constantimarinum furrinae]|uniref:Capsular polysaccharide biosynthesis protein n=1 Tax=Constantimarinum furrinae TaxID=2562285 RepID=A0A7G8PX73_9FLAO|nr:nucleoside-diphosphate sugar epimerase/dehydratase [Constantimarinum furrinae]QNJ98939.1 capsular polysaccharide biosynthesis protein [Constantimarinum furrinae]
MSIAKKILSTLYKGDNSLKMLDQRYLPRWIVLLIDTFLVVVSIVLVYLILLGTPIKFLTALTLIEQGVAILAVNVTFFFVFKTYSGIIRHSTFTDILKLALSAFFTLITLLVLNSVYAVFEGQKIFLTTSILLYILLSFTIMLLFRIAVKESYQFLRNSAADEIKKKVVIVGVDDHTISVGKALTTESNLPFQLIGFLTENLDSKRYKILGKPVIPIKNSFSETINKLEIDGVLLIGESISGKRKNQLVEDCIANSIEIFNVPIVEKWNKKEDIRQQIKPLEIEDLLQRDPITIDNELIKNDLESKTILVTGGAGSIGSEIVRQIAEFNPKQVVILDQAESVLHELELYLQLNYPSLNFITELADISNMYRLGLLFHKYKFDVIYHAAAYKHVPLIERNPHEAIYVNILGTVNLSILAVSNDIQKFVMVSTDKAVNPTNVMGASKRVAEMYVQSLQYEEDIPTKFITTRFGNVLGSSGSVIPHFRKQIAQGGPVTVTHKDIIRYFMTIPEACQLVLQAGTMGNGGEIYVFDMGEPVRILDLAERMIRLSGLEPYEDVDIKISGLRPGEKLYEELLNDMSTSLPTHHPKIMISKVPVGNFSEIREKVKVLIETATRGRARKVVELLKDLVPEYISENSEFEVLDQPKSTESKSTT